MLMKTRKTLVPSMILRCCCLRSSKPSPLVSSASSKSHGLVTPRLTPPVMRLDLKRTAVSDFQPKPRSPHTPRSQDRLPDGSVHVCCAPQGSLQAQQTSQAEYNNLQEQTHLAGSTAPPGSSKARGILQLYGEISLYCIRYPWRTRGIRS